MTRIPRLIRLITVIATSVLILAVTSTASAQTNDLTIVKGSGDYIDEAGTYGDPNLFLDQPGSRYSAATWTDLSGNLWLFGGVGYNTSFGLLNDLWKFNPDNNTWVLVRASGNHLDQIGVYGDPNPSNNYPGSRMQALAWVDQAGDLWLFGGFGFGITGTTRYLNDLWRFDPDTGIWTLEGGSGNYENQSGVYADPTAANNHPGSRTRAAEWVDASGKFWLFGGDGYNAAGAAGYLNDLWKYDPLTNIWMFVAGTGNYRNQF